jgi:hypothetical protein
MITLLITNNTINTVLSFEDFFFEIKSKIFWSSWTNSLNSQTTRIKNEVFFHVTEFFSLETNSIVLLPVV